MLRGYAECRVEHWQSLSTEHEFGLSQACLELLKTYNDSITRLFRAFMLFQSSTHISGVQCCWCATVTSNKHEKSWLCQLVNRQSTPKHSKSLKTKTERNLSWWGKTDECCADVLRCKSLSLRGRRPFAFPRDEDAEEHLGSKIMSQWFLTYFDAKNRGLQYSAVVANSCSVASLAIKLPWHIASHLASLKSLFDVHSTSKALVCY